LQKKYGRSPRRGLLHFLQSCNREIGNFVMRQLIFSPASRSQSAAMRVRLGFSLVALVLVETVTGQNVVWRDPFPVMLVHGDMDFIPVQQVEEFFKALYRQDKRVRMV
jgi:hypothetical protein